MAFPRHLLLLLCGFAIAMLFEPVTIPAAEPITFSSHIAEIVQRNCLECHRRGGAAPFSLATYREVAEQFPRLREVINRGEMPPWLPAGNYSEFQGDRRLTAADERAFELWFNAGLPEGTPAETPIPPAFAKSWQSGKPDFVLRPQPLVLGNLPSSNILMAELPKEEDGWVSGLELLPKHTGFQHALLWLDLPMRTQLVEIESSDTEKQSYLTTAWRWRERLPLVNASPFRPVQRARAVEARDRRLLGVWSFDQLSQSMPAGTAFRFPAGSRLIVETTSSVERPPLEIGLHLEPDPPKNLAITAALEPRSINLLGRQSEQPLIDQFQVPVDCELHSLAPHTNGPCREVHVSLTLPSGKTEPLLWIDHWNARWERTYTFRRPVQIPKNSRIDARFLFATTGTVSVPSASQEATLLAALLSPVNPAQYDELTLAIQKHQIEIAKLPVVISRR